jgi:hypothetical protein
LQDLRGHLYPFCRDQHGSRLVQQQLEAAAPEELEGAYSFWCWVDTFVGSAWGWGVAGGAGKFLRATGNARGKKLWRAVAEP